MNAIGQFARSVVSSRRHQGLSQEALAALAGLDRTYISGIERGLRNPTLRTAERIASALGVPLVELLRDSP